jgi:hypothetical protein
VDDISCREEDSVCGGVSGELLFFILYEKTIILMKESMKCEM